MLPVRRFREFVNLTAFTDVSASDEVVDVLSFLACEMVRSLCEAAVAAKQTMANSRTTAAVGHLKEDRKRQEEKLARSKAKGKKRAVDQDDVPGGGASSTTPAAETPAATAPTERTARETSASAKKARKVDVGASPRRVLYDPISLFSEPFESVASGMTTPRGGNEGGSGHSTPNLATLEVQDVNWGYSALQRGKLVIKASGMQNWRGTGLRRPKAGLI